MHPALIPLVTLASQVYQDRIKKKSTVDGAAIATSALIGATANSVGTLPAFPADSLEGYIVSLVIAAFGIYRIFKKG